MRVQDFFHGIGYGRHAVATLFYSIAVVFILVGIVLEIVAQAVGEYPFRLIADVRWDVVNKAKRPAK